jgi:hypothetical protein
MNMPPTVDEFTEAFIAALVERGVISLDPNSEDTNVGIGRVHALVSRLAAASQIEHEKRWFIRLKNGVAPSNIGTYDFFLAALRSCQLGFAASPNPRYSEITFKVSRPHAAHFLGKSRELLRKTAMEAADAFLGQPSEPSASDAGERADHVHRGHSGVAA